MRLRQATRVPRWAQVSGWGPADTAGPTAPAETVIAAATGMKSSRRNAELTVGGPLRFGLARARRHAVTATACSGSRSADAQRPGPGRLSRGGAGETQGRYLENVDAVSRTCEHCGTQNFVAECRQDGRRFVLTTAHLEGRLREFDDGPIQELPVGFELPLCDFCASKARGLGPMETTMAGLRQGTCPACHTECLAD